MILVVATGNGVREVPLGSGRWQDPLIPWVDGGRREWGRLTADRDS